MERIFKCKECGIEYTSNDNESPLNFNCGKKNICEIMEVNTEFKKELKPINFSEEEKIKIEREVMLKIFNGNKNTI